MSDILRKQNRMMNCPAVTAGQIPYRNVTVKDKLDELDSRASANTFGTAVDITSYNSSSNTYTFPSDGYVNILNDYSGATSVYAGYLLDANGVNYSGIPCVRCTQNNRAIFFVKKGMKIYFSSPQNGQGAHFCPLEGSALPSAESEGF